MTLLAPNGKPSNLTPYQYKLVRTIAFKKWFGDWEKNPEKASKVIDENGEPLVVYHGTYNYFDSFDKKNKAHYFSENPKYASQVAFGNLRVPKGQNIMPCFLNIRKAIFFSNSVNHYSVQEYLRSKFYKEDNSNGIKGRDAGSIEQAWVVFDTDNIKSAIGDKFKKGGNIFDNKNKSNIFEYSIGGL